MLQVSIQTFLDGSGQLTFKNLTLLGASSRAHYEAYGPSVTLQLTNTVSRPTSLLPMTLISG